MNPPADTGNLGTSPGIPADESKVSRALWLMAGALAVLLAYSLPCLMNRSRHGEPFLNVAFSDEKIYLARVVDAYRGGSLGNPYLAEHQGDERFMPELAERLLAFMAHVTHMSPLMAVAVSRILFPVLIYALLWSIALGLGMEPRLATLAALLILFKPVIFSGYNPGFLRYSRAISPAFCVMLLLVALRAVQFARAKATWWAALSAGGSLGLLFYSTSIYYWTLAIGGVAWLAVAAKGRVRTTLLASMGIALIIGVPFFVKALHQEHLPDVRATMARLDLLTPGRSPDIFASYTALVAPLVLAAFWLWRQKFGDSGRFLLPFMCLGTFFMVQNVITNRHLQGWHWVDCLLPIWSLAAVALVRNSGIPIRTAYVTVLIAVLAASAIFFQTAAYLRWADLQKDNPEFWALDARMPRTLEWLNQNTRPNSVVVAAPELSDLLVLFTHNKVYWAQYAPQYVVPELEVEARIRSIASWRPDGGARLPFRADFYLGTGSTCLGLNGTQLLYRNQSEQTCVLAVSSPT